MNTSLTIAGTDPSGGAGIQADIKTMTVHNVYATSVITSLVSQNTTGVFEILDVPISFIQSQMRAVFEDIVPESVKIGMVSNKEVIVALATQLKKYEAKNIVVDPVMVATSGDKLLKEDAIQALKQELLPLASIITPNLKEAEVLCGFTIKTKEDMEKAAQVISNFCKGWILIKGGHSKENADDLLYKEGELFWFCSPKIDNPNTHGTGCTLSSAIASNLAKGLGVKESVQKSKEFLTGVIAAQLNLGKGRGPLNHCYLLK